MGFFDRLGRLLRANLNHLVSNAEDPAKILDQSVIDMQADLEKLRQAVAAAMASQKRLARQAEQAQDQATIWYQRAEQAIQKGEEALAKEALIRRKTFQETYSSLSNQLVGQDGQVEMLKRSLISLEGKIAQARTKKDMLKARAQAAQAQQQLGSAVGALGSNSAISAFERMEDKVEELEASGLIAEELAGSDLESKFASIEGSDDIDEELSKLRNNLHQGTNAPTLIGSSDQSSLESISISEVEIESLDNDDATEEFKESKREIEEN
ncbi:PspA/IM30 family protein [Prochlorococcus marinus]|nr:PspA/IM30 family protein [Prochlorococcus marinus]